ncbi:MAG: TetR family transcriptional regulator [Gammaproteobacteria bacterium]|nr:TetR family transcriptional regulator [Gammaproteobacteria bacterium]MBT5723155.1 TetR family transcriptional regulator [Gammaproteobacteria bacterium]MDG1232698.1 TetR/AcrR family transcriptional regulator [Pseudomonadales bacterium]
MSTNAVQKPRDKHFTTILLAAQEEFATHGLKGARMQAIADRAGLPKANVHYYFQNKVSLYLAVLDNIIATWDDFFNDVSVNDDPAAALDTFIREKVRLSFENPTASRLFANEILQGAPYLTDYMSEVLRPWVNNRAKVIREWMNAGKMIASDPVLLIFMIWASTQHYADFQAQVLGILGRKEYDDDLISQVSDFTSQTILRGCGLEPPNKEAMAHQ